MPANYIDLYNAVNDPESSFVKKVATAMASAANLVLLKEEPKENGGQRRDWAERVLGGGNAPLAAAQRWAWLIAQADTLKGDPALAEDAAIQDVVDALIDTMARAS